MCSQQRNPSHVSFLIHSLILSHFPSVSLFSSLQYTCDYVKMHMLELSREKTRSGSVFCGCVFTTVLKLEVKFIQALMALWRFRSRFAYNVWIFLYLSLYQFYLPSLFLLLLVSIRRYHAVTWCTWACNVDMQEYNNEEPRERGFTPQLVFSLYIYILFTTHSWVFLPSLFSYILSYARVCFPKDNRNVHPFACPQPLGLLASFPIRALICFLLSSLLYMWVCGTCIFMKWILFIMGIVRERGWKRVVDFCVFFFCCSFFFLAFGFSLTWYFNVKRECTCCALLK